MVIKKLKLWMKVTPHKKTADGRMIGLENSVVWQNAQQKNQDYLYIASKPLRHEYQEYLLSLNYRDKCGDYFHVSDFEKYNI